mmetsp:Transcript_13355/g.41877  ORF Transcript_13355/g.41877 Transcript_13355/m.41877 type:complete len:86 (+) Transcript_13355:514-771(+)
MGAEAAAAAEPNRARSPHEPRCPRCSDGKHTASGGARCNAQKVADRLLDPAWRAKWGALVAPAEVPTVCGEGKHHVLAAAHALVR